MVNAIRQFPGDSKHVLGDLPVTSLLVTSGDHPSYLILLLCGTSQEGGKERLREVGFGGHTHDHSTQNKDSEFEASPYHIARLHLKTKQDSKGAANTYPPDAPPCCCGFSFSLGCPLELL